MDPVRLTHELVANGSTYFSIAQEVDAGVLTQIRRGAYARAATTDAVAAHRQLLTATLAQTHPRAVVSHGSAAVLHGLPVPRSSIERVHLTRDRRGGGQRRTWLQVHGHPIDPCDMVELDGLAVTDLARTVVDLGCTLPVRDSVAVGDAALRRGASADGLLSALCRVGSRRGVAAARRVLELVDARSESYGESISRVVLVENGLRPTELQLEVRDRTGSIVARSDFAWPELGVLGEFDGRVKYGPALEPGRDAAQVLWDEKQREDVLRDLGWQVVRWVWSDLDDPSAWFARLRRAFERGRRLPLPT